VYISACFARHALCLPHRFTLKLPDGFGSAELEDGRRRVRATCVDKPLLEFWTFFKKSKTRSAQEAPLEVLTAFSRQTRAARCPKKLTFDHKNWGPPDEPKSKIQNPIAEFRSELPNAAR
jgi:hypothetical protein